MTFRHGTERKQHANKTTETILRRKRKTNKGVCLAVVSFDKIGFDSLSASAFFFLFCSLLFASLLFPSIRFASLHALFSFCLVIFDHF